MLQYILCALLLLCGSNLASAQATRITAGGTLPATCSVGSIYLKTGTGAGFYICYVTNTWELASAAGADGAVLFNDNGSIGGFGSWDGTTLALADGGYAASASLGPELLTNPDFTGSATGWTLGTGWSYGSDAVTHANGSTESLSQGITTIEGQTYQITITAAMGSIGGGRLEVFVGGVQAGSFADFDGTGPFVYTVVAADDTGVVLNPESDYEGTLTSVSLQSTTPANLLDLVGVTGAFTITGGGDLFATGTARFSGLTRFSEEVSFTGGLVVEAGEFSVNEEIEDGNPATILIERTGNTTSDTTGLLVQLVNDGDVTGPATQGGQFQLSVVGGTLDYTYGLIGQIVGEGSASTTTAHTLNGAYSAADTFHADTAYVNYLIATLTDSATVGNLFTDYQNVNIADTSVVTTLYGTYFVASRASGAEIGDAAAIWIGNLTGLVTTAGHSAYPFWYDGGGSDCSAGGVTRINDFGIFAYYNPCFDPYTPGSANFERIILRFGDTGVFGTDNIAYLGVEAGGTGTARAVELIGGGLRFQGTLVTPASTGTRYLCIDTNGIVTSSASACSGT